MVQKIECYVDGKGGLHRSAADAHRADVTQWFQASGAVNEAGAAALAKALVDDRDKLFELISMLEAVARDTCVQERAEEGASGLRTVLPVVTCADARQRARQRARRLA